MQTHKQQLEKITKITKEIMKHITDIKGNQETNKPKQQQKQKKVK